MALKEDYKDAVFAGLRKYKMLDNGDGTVSPVDMTEYEAAGDKFGAKDVNAITKTVNATGEIIADDNDEFKPNQKYEIGRIVIYDNKTWRFKVDHEPGEWDERQVERTNILAVIAEQNKNFGGLVFGQDESGAWGYRVGGADPVIPFKQSIEIRQNFYNAQGSGSRTLTYNIPVGKDGYMILWQDYVSTKSESICSVSGAKLVSNRDGIYNMQYDRQAMQIYTFTGGATIKITRGTYSAVSGVYVIILY